MFLSVAVVAVDVAAVDVVAVDVQEVAGEVARSRSLRAMRAVRRVMMLRKRMMMMMMWKLLTRRMTLSRSILQCE